MNSPSPLLSLRVLLHLAESEKQKFRHGAKALSDCTYLDDIFIGSNTLKELKCIQAELINLLKCGDFHLHKWTSNHLYLLENIPIFDRQKNDLFFVDSQDTSMKVLRLKWPTNLDLFSYDIVTMDRLCTERSILSKIVRIFDPLGILTPLVFFTKHLIQYLWTQG